MEKCAEGTLTVAWFVGASQLETVDCIRFAKEVAATQVQDAVQVSTRQPTQVSTQFSMFGSNEPSREFPCEVVVEQLEKLPVPTLSESLVLEQRTNCLAKLTERDDSPEQARARIAESNLTYVEQRTLRAFMDMSAQVRPSISIIRQFLSKKADLPPTRKRKQAVFDERPSFKASPTTGEALALVAFLVYLLLTSVGTVQIGSIPLVGPSIGGAATAAPTKEDVRKLSQAISDTSIKDARALSASGDKKGSFAAIDHSLKVMPTADAYAERARMASALGYQDLAVNDYNRAIEVRKDPSVLLERGLVHLSSKNYSSAIADFSTVICLPSVEDKFRVYAFRARAYAQSGRNANAVKDYTTAISLAPSPDYPELAGYRNELSKCMAKVRQSSHARKSRGRRSR